ncbi:hypothetical protein G7Y89_g4796 [Cudoniella acicularis]|uniref:Uncharacterized protein n=1 Tax=Cudoniella acicularis TaxID=354080 RepID=A0A8H4RQX2_9HELO|nr:hypothetical protein G7Y89_g4796 [Cudoniella acicularis]
MSYLFFTPSSTRNLNIIRSTNHEARNKALSIQKPYPAILSFDEVDLGSPFLNPEPDCEFNGDPLEQVRKCVAGHELSPKIFYNPSINAIWLNDYWVERLFH